MSTITLPSKPGASLAYEVIEGGTDSNLLVVFLNGLGLPQAFWKPTIEILRSSDLASQPRILTYDRYGQGLSAPDPRANDPKKDPGYAHDLDDVVDDLQELLQTVTPDRLDRVVLVSNSIGANVARRYANRHPGVVKGLLFLDSNPATLDFATVWPNPHNSSFDFENMVPPGTTREAYEAAYKTVTSTFGASAKNKEGFDRRTITQMLPDPSEPKLVGSKDLDQGPWITVLGHENETFSRQEWEMMKIPIGMAARYTNPAWHKYNEGLCRLTSSDRAKGPLIVPNAGHFIQKDNPGFVAEQLVELLENVERGT